MARRMVVAPHRNGGQAQFVERPMPPPAESLALTCAWITENLAERMTVATLAKSAGWAPRTFARKFLAETGTTPAAWITAERIREARQLLETTDETIARIGQLVGLGSDANTRELIKRDTGLSPSH